MTDGGDGCNLICHLSALKNVGKRLLCNAYGLCNSRLCAIYVLFCYRDLFRYWVAFLDPILVILSSWTRLLSSFSAFCLLQ